MLCRIWWVKSLVSKGSNSGPTGGASSSPGWFSWCSTMSDSSRDHSTSSERWCHPNESQPPGRRTRAHSAAATPASNQCHAWKTVTASTEPLSTGMSSAPPAMTEMRVATFFGRASSDIVSVSRIPSEGSMAMTSYPSAVIARSLFRSRAQVDHATYRCGCWRSEHPGDRLCGPFRTYGVVDGGERPERHPPRVEHLRILDPAHAPKLTFGENGSAGYPCRVSDT